MAKYTFKADSNLDISAEAFGARIDRNHNKIFLPEKLAALLEDQSIGNDAVAAAGYLSAFPSAIAGTLGLNASAVLAATQALIALLAKSGEDISRLQRQRAAPRIQAFGARHPSELCP